MKNKIEIEISGYLSKYVSQFQCGNHSKLIHCEHYISGLLHDCKSNIERMQERVPESDYQQLHHFISESPWDGLAVMDKVGELVSSSLNLLKKPVGLLFDESGWEKSGQHSVGVSRQYIGNVGKVCNSVNGVFAALSSDSHVGLVGGRLYLPQGWVSDSERCSKAGIPLSERVYRSKPELAIEIHKNLPPNVRYDWVGGDAIYGNSPVLRHYLEQQHQSYVLDVGEELGVYLNHPQPFIPEKAKKGRGRTPTQYKSLEEKVILKDLLLQIGDNERQTINHRQGTKGALVRKAVIKDIYIWNPDYDDKVETLQLLISTETDGSEVKFSLCYQHEAKLDLQTALFRQMQRYFVERGFQNVKEQLGLHQYQVRTWKAWYHHIALTMMALDFLLQRQLDLKVEYPLISCNDVKLLFAKSLPNKLDTLKGIIDAMNVRHKNRLKDILRYQNST